LMTRCHRMTADFSERSTRTGSFELFFGKTEA